MKALMLVMASAALIACAARDEKAAPSTQDPTQAVRDFIEVRELEELSRLRSGSRDRWTSIDDRFLVYEGRRETYLVEFYRRCYDLSSTTNIIADERWDANTINARSDTIRGCQIAKIYALTEAEAEELRHIGEAPGSRN